MSQTVTLRSHGPRAINMHNTIYTLGALLGRYLCKHTIVDGGNGFEKYISSHLNRFRHAAYDHESCVDEYTIYYSIRLLLYTHTYTHTLVYKHRVCVRVCVCKIMCSEWNARENGIRYIGKSIYAYKQ